MRQQTRQRHNYFSSRFASNDDFSVFTRYVNNNSLKFQFDEQISRNLLRKNAYRRLNRSDAACINTVFFANKSQFTIYFLTGVYTRPVKQLGFLHRLDVFSSDRRTQQPYKNKKMTKKQNN